MPEVNDDKNKPDVAATLTQFGDALKQQGEAIQGIMAKLETLPKETPKADPDDVQFETDDTFNENSVKSVIDRITPIVSKAAATTAARIVSDNQEQERTLSSLKSEYPELKNKDHQLTKDALQIFKSLPETERTARGMEYAAIKAAQKLGVTPFSQREASGDDYVIGGGSKGTKPAGKKNEELTDAESIWSEEMGLDPKKVGERNASRTGNWNQYSTPRGGKR